MNLSKPNSLEFIVRDSGVGIPHELLGDIFDPTKATTRLGIKNEKGTGFGMPLVKNYLEMLGGTISLVSGTNESHAASRGTTITISLPRHSAELKSLCNVRVRVCPKITRQS